MNRKIAVLIGISGVGALVGLFALYTLHYRPRSKSIAGEEVAGMISLGSLSLEKAWNSGDPPVISGIWYDRSFGIDNALRCIEENVPNIDEAVKGIYFGAELLPTMKLSSEALHERCANGDTAAQFVLAVRFKTGLRVTRNHKEYDRLLDLAANAKFPLALRERALKTDRKHEAVVNPTNASAFIRDTLFESDIRKASELGDPVAMYFLGDFLYNKKDGLIEASTWLGKALDSNDPLALLCCHGYLVNHVEEKDRYLVFPKNYSMSDSYRYLNDRSNHGVQVTQEWLADFCLRRKIPADFFDLPLDEAGIALYHKAANSGRVSAQRFLGEAYAKGNIVPRDSLKAAHYLCLAANQGEYPATTLGIQYEEGDGVPRDISEAVKWLKRGAIRNNDKDAQKRLGHYYWNGIGVPKNLLVALALYNLAGDDYSLRSVRESLSNAEILSAESLCRDLFAAVQKYQRERAANEQ